MRSTMILMALLAGGSCRQNTPPEARSEPRTSPSPAPPSPPRPASHGPRVVVHTRGGQAVTFDVEVARNDAQRMRGLMFRREMADDHGMIFMFPEATHQTFWMHNTLIPLDMIFIKPDRTILGVYRNATPETDDPRDVPGDSQYVFEVNGGLCARRGIQTGDRVEFVNLPPAATE